MTLINCSTFASRVQCTSKFINICSVFLNSNCELVSCSGTIGDTDVVKFSFYGTKYKTIPHTYIGDEHNFEYDLYRTTCESLKFRLLFYHVAQNANTNLYINTYEVLFSRENLKRMPKMYTSTLTQKYYSRLMMKKLHSC